MKWLISLLGLIWVLPLWAQEAKQDWRVYEDGKGLQLAVDANSLWREKDGLIHFMHQEQFASRRYEKLYQIYFDIRRTEGYADCKNYRFVFVSSYYFDKNGKHIFSTMFPVQRHSWKWQSVYDGTVSAAMMKLICDAAGS